MSFRGPWQSQYVQYNLGDVVEYQGQYFYPIGQIHHGNNPIDSFNSADWPPNATPALWQETDRSQYQGAQPQDQPVHQAPPPPSQTIPNGDGFSVNHDNGGYKLPNGEEVPHEETKTHWYDVGDDKKKQILMGGGLALGLGLLGGGLYMAHEKHEKNDEKEREAQAWELQNWVLEAHKHTEQFFRDGPRGPTTWILNDAFEKNPHLLKNAIEGGEEDGKLWYICRAPYHGSLQVGKCRFEPDNVYGYIGYSHDSITVRKFEVLIGDREKVEWVKAENHFNRSNLRHEPVYGGHDADKSELFIARTEYKGARHPGKCSENLKGGWFTYGDGEKSKDEYDVLCYID
ncbi:hypothetical protein F5884DRAFT_889833 [Xylogone sp. PMI_703]|nr:hypothetical protein F5884DRAFT_889833 [Xylogone sp. PMI_703]